MAESSSRLVRSCQAAWRLSWPERWILIEALLLLPLLSLALQLLGFRRLYRALAWLAPAPDPDTGEGSAGLPEARAVAEGVQRAAWHSPLGSTCLTRSLVLWWLLRWRGIASEVHLGVAKEAAQLQAHAWVEHRGTVLNDDDEVRQRFVTLDLELDSALASGQVARVEWLRSGAMEGRKPR